jgi:hypothetical protein
VYVSAEKFKNRTISIYAEHGMKVDVHVTDEQGKPIEKASILWMSAGGARAQTDKDGNAVLSGVSRFRNGYLSVEAPGYESYVENDVYAPLYAKGGFQITLIKPQESHGD